ncbi:phage head-binding domain-containing protein [Proteus mirabilis]|uniref:phage head-binding domain-containing protein n=1 Tax=Proteus mirabilis TaxID=584 RepID=UPI0023F7C38A|nr:phage head-binding domain-containing protein [Proteus mirabilis]MDF7270690.1 phage head-binding domain-containing protein [Proteus mirabilis]
MSDIIPNVVVSMPSQLFTLAKKFQAASNGKIFIGKIDTDPTLPENQIQVYLENEDGSHIPVPQPLIINQAGFPVYNGQIAKFVTIEGHSMAVYDSYGAQQFYYPNVLKYEPDQFSKRIMVDIGKLRDEMVSSKFFPSIFGDELNIGDCVPESISYISTIHGYFRINPQHGGIIDKFNINNYGEVESITIDGINVTAIPINPEISPNYTPYLTLSDKVESMLYSGIDVIFGPYNFEFEKPVNLPITNSTIPKIRGVGNRTKIYASFDSSTDSIFQFKGNGNDWVRGVDIGDFEFINPHKNQTGLIDINQCLRGINISNITGFWCPRGIKLTKSYGAGSMKNIRLYLYDSVDFNHVGTYGIICESNAISADTIETVGGYEIGQRWRGDSIFVSNWNSAGADDYPQNQIRKAIEVNGRQVVQLRSGYIERPYVPTGENINNVIMAEFNDTDQLDVDGINLGAGSIDVKNCRGKIGGLFFGTISNGITYDDKCDIIEGLITHYHPSNKLKPIIGSYWDLPKKVSGNISRLFNQNTDGFIPYRIRDEWRVLPTDTDISLGISRTSASVSLTRTSDDSGDCFLVSSPQYQGIWLDLKDLEPLKTYTVVILIRTQDEETKSYFILRDNKQMLPYKPISHYAKSSRMQKIFVSFLSSESGKFGLRLIHDNPATKSFKFYGYQVNRGVSDSL